VPGCSQRYMRRLKRRRAFETSAVVVMISGVS